MATPTPAPTPCPTSWTGPTFCECNEPVPSSCLLWGVSFEWLIIAAVIWSLACLGNRIVDLLIAIVGIILRSYNRVEWTDIIKKHMVYWTTKLTHVGLGWAGVAALQLPPEVYNVLRYFFAIPFFIILFPWVNVLFDTISRIVTDYLAKKEVSPKLKGKERQDPDMFEDKDEDKAHLLPAASPDGAGGAADDPISGADANHALEEFIRVLKYLAFILLFILGLESNGISVVSYFQDGTLFTLSIVFAAQPWIRNLFGGLSVFFDGKYRVNDNIRVVGMEGTVVGITLRSTVLRRPDNALVYIPNARVLEQPVNNLSRRAARLLQVRVKISHRTPAAQIRVLLNELEHSLRVLHPSLTSHPSNRLAQAKLADPAKDFFVVLDNMYEVLVWTHTSGDEREDKAFSEIQSEVMLAIASKMEELGIRSAAEDEGASGADEMALERHATPERRSVGNLRHEQGRPFLYTMISDDYENDDTDLSMAGVALLSASGGSAGGAATRGI